MNSITLSATQIRALREKLLALPAVMPMLDDPKFTSLIAALGIHQEVGTINDELARFVYDPDSGAPLGRERMRSELVEYRGFYGVKITADGYAKLDIRLHGLRELLHPSFSFAADGSIRACVIFPESVARIAHLKQAQLVLVREWALNTIFGGFDPTRLFYETNTWELVQNDTLRYASLLAHRQIAFLGTHDLTAHAAGLASAEISKLCDLGARTRQRLERYFNAHTALPIAGLVLPYAAGVLLDDLAQPRNYGSPGRGLVLELVMQTLDQKVIDTHSGGVLLTFPPAYEKLIRLARDPNLNRIKVKAPKLIRQLVSEIDSNTLVA